MSTPAPRTVVHFSDSAAFGGTERALLQLLAGLDRARWRPVLFHADVPGARQLAGEAAALDVPTHAIAAVEQPMRGVASLPELARAFRRERAAVFHAHQTWSLSCRYGIVAAALARVPARVASAQLFLEMPKLAGIDAQHALLTRCLHKHVAVSRFVARRLHERFSVPMGRIVVIPNAVEPPAPVARDARLRTEIAGGERRPLAVTVARLDTQKGIAHLIDAAALVPDVVFAIAGDGPDRAALEARAAQQGVRERVRFLGHRRDVPALLAIADLFVLPSLYEGFPLSVLEAMAAGVPVVATAVGGTDELVSRDTGTLVAPADPRALADGIRTVLANPGGAARRAAIAQEYVLDTHSASAMVASMSNLYDSLLAR
ncbi:MAG TPA: glycosyltransferase [Gemmatimonadaceae bacterium]